ncbi:unnamed protein product [Thelazia callipaeda]|uniref:B9 domain-containing protein 2 n=1 Tax=Thelazia callipaeda TaxID=103827 RepID=A0A0N5D4F0_THECL|nr:unnamed protein product [Thelazia callipaeda]
MVEVHVIGEIESASGFREQRLSCRWQLEFGGGWRVIEGVVKGETQTDVAEYNDFAFFAHPLDIHLATKTVQGWPIISLQIWHSDEFGRQEVYGYGSVYLPASPGEHKIKCHMWRPKGDIREELMHYFLGGGLQLTSQVTARLDEYSKLRIISMGIIEMRISLITKYFDRFGIQC